MFPNVILAKAGIHGGWHAQVLLSMSIVGYAVYTINVEVIPCGRPLGGSLQRVCKLAVCGLSAFDNFLYLST